MTEAERKGIVGAVIRGGALAALAVDHALTEMAAVVQSSRDAAIAAEQRIGDAAAHLKWGQKGSRDDLEDAVEAALRTLEGREEKPSGESSG